MADITKIIDRVRKYLNLANSTNEHEAAQAAGRAAQLMEEWNLTEAAVRLSDGSKVAEAITEATLAGTEKIRSRVAWKITIASAVGYSLGVRMYTTGGVIRGFGRESSVQAWNYTTGYLINEVERLTAARWDVEHLAAVAAGHSARVWCGSFRIGAAQAIAGRLSHETRTRKAARVPVPAVPGDLAAPTNALMVLEADEKEVEAAYAARSKGFGRAGNIGSVRARDGYAAGSEAGQSVALGAKRAGLAAGQGRLS